MQVATRMSEGAPPSRPRARVAVFYTRRTGLNAKFEMKSI